MKQSIETSLKISFLMMAKNSGDYISEAINALIDNDRSDLWELIIVDDHSTDATFEIVKTFAKNDRRIKIFHNPSTGKVNGTNFAYEKSTCAIIKCIDSDDILLPNFFDLLLFHSEHDVISHSCSVTDEKLNLLASYHSNSEWLISDTRSVVENVVSLPKFSWSFTREVAEKVFPMNEHLPFEDAWMSLLLKIHSVNPLFSREKVYLYRQHSAQTFSGILNYSTKAIEFRARRLLRLIDILESDRFIGQSIQDIDFGPYRRCQRYLCGDMSFFDFVITIRITNFRTTVRSIILKDFQMIAPAIVKFKWAIDAYHIRRNITINSRGKL